MNDSTPETTGLPFTIVVNNNAELEYHRDKALPAQQRAYLEQMDRKMDRGITLGGARVVQPDSLQRAQFVALQVLQSLQQGDDALTAAGCAYLANRLPDLTQVKAGRVEDGYSVELVFNEPYGKEVAVQFMPKRLS